MADKLLSQLLKGTYNNATSYTIGDIVDYEGSSYACKANTTGNLPTNTTYWAMLAEKGAKGDVGDTGDAATITTGTVDTVPFGDPATVTNSGSSSAAIFDFEIPQGGKGDAATISVGTVNTVSPTDPATVTNIGTSSEAVFDFNIPQGEQGLTGDDGAKVISVAFSGNNIVFTLDDASTVTLTDAKIELKGDIGDTGAKITSAAFVGDDLVFTLDDTSTVTIIDAKTSLKGDKGDTGDIGITWQGAWSAGTYQINDGVSHNGSSWIATAVTTQTPSGAASDWDLVAEKGADGAGSGDMMAATYDPTNVAGDAFARANHSGTQAISTVTNLQTSLNGKQPLATVLTNTTASFTTAQETKLTGIETGAQVNTVTSVASKTGAVTLVKGDVGLSNVDNTSDVNKPVSTAQQTALNLKANLISPSFTTPSLGVATADSLEVNGTTSLNVMAGFDTAGDVTFNRSDGVNRPFRIEVLNNSTPATNYMRFKVHNGTVGQTADVLTLLGNGNASVVGNLTANNLSGTNTGDQTKEDLSLGNVDNTSDATKNSANAILTNKTITDSTNNVTANGLRSATTTVSVSGATAPTTGQVLTATNSTTATWQDASGGGGETFGEVSLSSSQILNLHTTPIELIPAPGAGKLAVITQWFIVATGTAYEGGNVLNARYDGSTVDLVNRIPSFAFVSPGLIYSGYPLATLNATVRLEDGINKSVEIQTATAFTTGTATAKVFFKYHIYTL